MIGAWWAFLRSELSQGEAIADPWDEGAYQIARCFMGVLLASAVVFGFDAWYGVIVGKWVPILIVGMVAKAIERRQGWLGYDTLADMWFWLLGATGVAYTFNEEAPGDLEPDPLAFLIGLFVLALSLIVHLNSRVVNKYGAN